MTNKVRTTMTPDVELEVSDKELSELRRQGLLVEEKETNKKDESKAKPSSSEKE